MYNTFHTRIAAQMQQVLIIVVGEKKHASEVSLPVVEALFWAATDSTKQPHKAQQQVNMKKHRFHLEPQFQLLPQSVRWQHNWHMAPLLSVLQTSSSSLL